VYCSFCAEAIAGHLPYDANVGLDSRILRETEHFLVVVDISPLCRGHLLIVPREHYLAFGAIPLELRCECDALVSETVDILARSYSPPIIMEHGSSTCHSGGACVEHAHLQIVPCDIDILPAMQKFTPRKLTDFWHLSKLASANMPYLYLCDQAHCMYVADDISGIEKQFIRKEIGTRMNIPYPEWDWRQNKRLPLLHETYHELAKRWTHA
jgi:diadenosine tetraphosphate (Ap4A) HIT family hydrolase